MHEDDEEFGNFLPLLRRIIVLVAVITAVPVILWTITAFVRAYVGPAKVPTFHQLAATASINVPTSTERMKPAGDRPAPTTERIKLPNTAPAAAEATATPNDQHDASAAPKGDRTPEIESTAAIPSMEKMPPADKTASAPVTVLAAPKGADVFPPQVPSLAATESKQPSAAVPVTPQPVAAPPPIPAPQQVAAAEQAADVLPAAAPLSGPIPLPRHRPHQFDAARSADAAPSNVPQPRHRPHDIDTVHVADSAPSAVPTPRPRPDNASGTAPSDDGNGPLGFFYNLFGGK